MLRGKTQLVAFLLVILLLGVLVPQHQARADGLFSLTGITSPVIEQVVNATLGIVKGFLLSGIYFSANILDTFIRWQTNNAIYDVGVVNESWTIIRNFVNLFFILVLIIMAFGTIFDIQRYTWKNILAPFLIAALLINFSLTIGQYIITVANGLSGVFLGQIGDVSGQFAQGFSAVKIVGSGSTNVLAGTLQVIISLAFSLFFLVIILLTFIAAALFSVARVFVLWFLLIISPIAWFGYTLPGLRSQTWSTWWKHFLCWCFWLPYFLFFVMFAVIFIGGKGQFPQTGNTSMAGLVGNDFMFYGLSLVFLIGGMGVARKLACASGTGVSMVFGKIETGVRKYAPGAAYVRGAVQGVKERGAEIAERGVFGIGGAQQARLQEATAKGWVAGVPGPGQVPGAREAASKAQAIEIDKETRRIKELNLTLDQLNGKLKSAKGPELYALRGIKAENGWNQVTDKQEVLDTVRELKGKALSGYLNSLEKGDFEKLFAGPKDKEDFVRNVLTGAEHLELKKKMLKNMNKNREIFDDTLIRQTVQLFENEAKDVQDKVFSDLGKNLSNVYTDSTGSMATALKASGPAAPPVKVKQLIAKKMASSKGKSGINDYATYKAAIDALGGEQSFEGQEFTEKVKENNELLLDEAKFRSDLASGTTGIAGLTINQAAIDGAYTLNNIEKSRLTDKYIKKLEKMDIQQIRSLSAESVKTPEMHTALNKYLNNPATLPAGITKPQFIKNLMKDLSKEKRVALQDALSGPSAAFTYT